MNTKLEISLKKSQDGLSVSAQATREIQSGSKSQKTEQNSEDYLYVELSVKFSPGTYPASGTIFSWMASRNQLACGKNASSSS